MGKSAKEILIPVQYLYEDISAGGILAIANHSAGFCDHVDIVTCLGTQNNYREFIAQKLKANVGSQFYLRSDAPTIVKRRYVEADFFRKLFEVYFMDGKVLPENISREVCDYLHTNLKKYDLVIVADYGHGFIDSDIIKTISDNAKFIALNVQTNSANAGFNLVTKYPRADFISINEPEIRLATHDNTSRIESLVPKIASQLNCNRIMITRGHRGSMFYAGGNNYYSAPAFSKEIVDRVGAGDAFLSVASLCAVNAFPPDLIPFIGNAVGALAIRIVGNKQSIDPVALSKYINTLLK
jgi:bifunctional ADP-heptose synthase (sugar kinase/adenylyltransferase)